MEAYRFSPTKEIQKGAICWQSDGFCVLGGLRECAHDRLFLKGQAINGPK